MGPLNIISVDALCQKKLTAIPVFLVPTKDSSPSAQLKEKLNAIAIK
jgi:hypothetical protein